MYQNIIHFPEQFATSWKIVGEADLGLLPSIPVKNFYLAGMGGSSLPIDLANDYLNADQRLVVIRDYHLPSPIDSRDLVFCISYSGDTEEILAIFEQAIKRNTALIAITNGGILAKNAQARRIPVIKIPQCIQPRCATGHFFTSIVGVLDRLGYIKPQQEAVLRLGAFLKERQQDHEHKGREIAKLLKDKVPIIYSTRNFYGACRIWKAKMNENAKIQSFYNVFPELNHNEMVGFTRLLMNPVILYLKSKFMHPRIRKRMDVMQELLSDKIPFYSIELQGENVLQEMFDANAIADFASYYLALSYGVDPAPVEMVETFKKRLNENAGPSD